MQNKLATFFLSIAVIMNTLHVTLANYRIQQLEQEVYELQQR